MNEDGYILAPKYGGSLHLVSKERFEIQLDKSWLRCNDSFVWYNLPMSPSHAWDISKRIFR